MSGHFGKPSCYQRLAAGSCLARHCHPEPYKVLVLEGSFLEAGDAGRHEYRTGDTITHPPFGSHANWVGPHGAVLLNCAFQGHETVRAGPAIIDGLPDLLAAALRDDTRTGIVRWARAQGVDPARVSREFRLAFGVSPKRYRAELRARRAFEGSLVGDLALVDLACSLGFSDQAHMTRAVTALSGTSPGQLRRIGRDRPSGREGVGGLGES